MSDVLQSAQVETIEFSAAELEEFQERKKAYHESIDAVNKWIAFLMKQHGIKQEDGWQLGETGFVREIKTAPQEAQPVNRTQEAERRRKQAAKGKAVQAPEPTPEPSTNGHVAELV